jgi:hypothetical protein
MAFPSCRRFTIRCGLRVGHDTVALGRITSGQHPCRAKGRHHKCPGSHTQTGDNGPHFADACGEKHNQSDRGPNAQKSPHPLRNALGPASRVIGNVTVIFGVPFLIARDHVAVRRYAHPVSRSRPNAFLDLVNRLALGLLRPDGC